MVIIHDGERSPPRCPPGRSPTTARPTRSPPRSRPISGKSRRRTCPTAGAGRLRGRPAELLASPSIASKRWVYDQYDSMVQTQTSPAGRGRRRRAASARHEQGHRPDHRLQPALLLPGPLSGREIAVAEAARNLSCVGATPLAVTDCLNFANPEKPDGFWQFRARSRALPMPARRWARLSSPATFLSTTRPRSGRSSRPRPSAWSACFPTPTSA